MSTAALLKNSAFNKFDGHCAYCGTELEYDAGSVKTVRVIKHEESPYWLLENLYPACQPCKYLKRNYSMEEMRSKLLERSKNYKTVIHFSKKQSDYLKKTFDVDIQAHNKEIRKANDKLDEKKTDYKFYFELHEVKL